MLIQPSSTLIMIGDSITDCGRSRSPGDRSDNALGNGYVRLLSDQFHLKEPPPAIRIINRGVSGNTIRELANRWQFDVLDLKPDWLSIMIGINDVWRQFDTPYSSEIHVSIDEYKTTLERLIGQTAPLLKGLILMTPYLIESNRADPMRAMMDRYGTVVRDLAESFDAVLVDTQAAFDAVLQTVHPQALAEDRVHPNHTGHMILAQAFLKAVEFIE